MALLGLVAASCASRRPPRLEPLLQRESRIPVVLIPGITGTRLRDPASGRPVWGSARNVFLPRDGGRSLALPPGAVPGDGGPGTLEVAGAVTRIRLFGLFTYSFYARIVRLMEANGYRHGDLRAPSADDTFFLFGYDWRYGNLHAVRSLGAALERLRRARGEPILRVVLICQSNAARIARYFVKYGAHSPDEAETGSAAPPPAVRVEKLILVGSANGGAIGNLKVLDRGRSYVPLVGRRIRPEALLGFLSVYESLPAYREAWFVDAAGRPLDVDLYDPANWRRYGWGFHGHRTRNRLARHAGDARFGSADERDAFLASALEQARRLQRLLRADAPGFDEPRYYLVQNGYRETPERAVLIRKDGVWRTRFLGDRAVDSDPWLAAVAASPGDGHATLASQNWLSPQEQAALAAPVVWVDERHRAIIQSRQTHRAILDFLADEPAARAGAGRAAGRPIGSAADRVPGLTYGSSNR